MKGMFCLACLCAIALCAGCSTVDTAPQVSKETPSLVGNWSGPVKGYIEGVGFRDSGDVSMTLIITEQQDRLFTGYMIFPLQSGSTRIENFFGVINRDKKTFRIVEHTSGYGDGTLVSEDEIELMYLDDTEPTMLTLDILKRTV